MKRIGAHYLYINPDILLKNGVIEIDNNGVVSDYFSLDNTLVESAHTEFYTGLLTPAFGITELTENNISPIQYLKKIQQHSPESSILDFIKSSPEKAVIEKNTKTDIWLLENIDLINLKVTPQTTIRKI